LLVMAAKALNAVLMLELLDRGVVSVMLARIEDKQLRHRIYQAALRGILKAIVEKLMKMEFQYY
jgi:putative transposase